jgi:hypothetical protein
VASVSAGSPRTATCLHRPSRIVSSTSAEDHDPGRLDTTNRERRSPGRPRLELTLLMHKTRALSSQSSASSSASSKKIPSVLPWLQSLNSALWAPMASSNVERTRVPKSSVKQARALLSSRRCSSVSSVVLPQWAGPTSKHTRCFNRSSQVHSTAEPSANASKSSASTLALLSSANGRIGLRPRSTRFVCGGFSVITLSRFPQSPMRD